MGKHQKGGNENIQKMGPKLDELLQAAAEAQRSDVPISERLSEETKDTLA
jgi:hypothetical protein